MFTLCKQMTADFKENDIDQIRTSYKRLTKNCEPFYYGPIQRNKRTDQEQV